MVSKTLVQIPAGTVPCADCMFSLCISSGSSASSDMHLLSTRLLLILEKQSSWNIFLCLDFIDHFLFLFQVTVFLCCAAILAIIQYCNFCQLSFWMRSALATTTGVTLLLLLNLGRYSSTLTTVYKGLNSSSNVTFARLTSNYLGKYKVTNITCSVKNIGTTQP